MAFIGIDRGIEEHWIYQDAEYFKVWFEILLRARYSKEPEKKMIEGIFVTVDHGQFIFGRPSWSSRLKVSEQRLRTLFKKLDADGMIELVQKYHKFSLYSVKNYAKYNQQSNQQKPEEYQWNEVDANQQSNRESTSSQPATNQQLTTQEQSKQRKQGNKVKKEIINAHEFAMFWESYPRKISKSDAEKAWDKLMKQKVDPAEIITCAMNYSAYVAANQTEPRFIKYPATFLNNDRYKDHLKPFLIHSKPAEVQKTPDRTKSGKVSLPMAQGSGKSLTPEEREELRRKALMLDKRQDAMP